jgi:transcriptional regulator with GAF, ATPase, and Fis domain
VDADELRTVNLRGSGEGVRMTSHKMRLEVVEGPDRGRSVEIRKVVARIGTDPACDLPLRDPTVSRQHLSLHLEGGRIRVFDSGSTNGTEVDAVLVRDAYAKPDSTITAGDTKLRLKMLTDDIILPLSQKDRFGGLLGKSAAMRRIFSLLERVAPTPATLLVLGETGTGKEVVAEAVHRESDRSKGPFVVFDCAAVAPTLVESELFGHARGAFTGATGDRIGAFELADGGTLFLDEVGELPIDLQPKLLRVLERSEVRRLGAAGPRRVDVRVIAATHRDLSQAVTDGKFRQDLYYRLAVITIELPPLRERTEDVALLAAHFGEELAPGSSAAIEAAVASWQKRTWPGNVRELRNAVARLLAMGTIEGAGAGRASSPEVEPNAAFGVDTSQPLHEALEAFERAYVLAAFEAAGSNVTRAAEIAGVTRQAMQRALARHGLRGE